MSALERGSHALGRIHKKASIEGSRFTPAQLGDVTLLVRNSPDRISRTDTVILKKGEPLAFASRILTREESFTAARTWHVFVGNQPDGQVRHVAYYINERDGKEVITLGFVGNLEAVFENGEEPMGKGAIYDVRTGELLEEPYDTWGFPLISEASFSESPRFLESVKATGDTRASIVSLWEMGVGGGQHQERVLAPIYVAGLDLVKGFIISEKHFANPEKLVELFDALGVKVVSENIDTRIQVDDQFSPSKN